MTEPYRACRQSDTTPNMSHRGWPCAHSVTALLQPRVPYITYRPPHRRTLHTCSVFFHTDGLCIRALCSFECPTLHTDSQPPQTDSVYELCVLSHRRSLHTCSVFFLSAPLYTQTLTQAFSIHFALRSFVSVALSSLASPLSLPAAVRDRSLRTCQRKLRQQKYEALSAESVSAKYGTMTKNISVSAKGSVGVADRASAYSEQNLYFERCITVTKQRYTTTTNDSTVAKHMVLMERDAEVP